MIYLNCKKLYTLYFILCTLCSVLLGQARPRPTALLPPRSNGKTRECYCSCGAPDDGREDGRNMFSRT